MVDNDKAIEDERTQIKTMMLAMFIGVRLLANPDETIEETCKKFSAVKLPIEVV